MRCIITRLDENTEGKCREKGDEAYCLSCGAWQNSASENEKEQEEGRRET